MIINIKTTPLMKSRVRDLLPGQVFTVFKNPAEQARSLSYPDVYVCMGHAYESCWTPRENSAFITSVKVFNLTRNRVDFIHADKCTKIATKAELNLEF